MIQSVSRPASKLVRVAQLSTSELARWSEIQQQAPELQSPYFRPEFTQLVAAVRSDVEVAVWERDGVAVAFFPFQRSRFNIGQPVGGRMSDFHGLIAGKDVAISGEELLAACNLTSWDFDHLILGQSAFETCPLEQFMSPYIDLTDGYEQWAEEKRTAKSSLFKNTPRYQRKLEREHQPLRFEWHTEDDTVFETLLEWKSEQYRRTGFDDLFQIHWIVELLQSIRQQKETEFAGRLAVMYSGDKIVAIHFGMQSVHVLHSWFPAYSLEFSDYRPGTILMLEIARQAEQFGITHFDLGRGDEQYKQSLMSAALMVGEGSLARPGFSTWCRQNFKASRRWVKESPIGPLAKKTYRLLKPVGKLVNPE